MCMSLSREFTASKWVCWWRCMRCGCFLFFSLFHWWCNEVQIHVVLISNKKSHHNIKNPLSHLHVKPRGHSSPPLPSPPFPYTRGSIYSRWEYACHRQSLVMCYMCLYGPGTFSTIFRRVLMLRIHQPTPTALSSDHCGSPLCMAGIMFSSSSSASEWKAHAKWHVDKPVTKMEGDQFAR